MAIRERFIHHSNLRLVLDILPIPLPPVLEAVRLEVAIAYGLHGDSLRKSFHSTRSFFRYELTHWSSPLTGNDELIYRYMVNPLFRTFESLGTVVVNETALAKVNFS